MENYTKEEKDDGQWAYEGGGQGSTEYPEPVFVTVPNDMMDDQVEIQEVVIVTDGGDETAEIQGVEATHEVDPNTGEVIPLGPYETVQEEAQYENYDPPKYEVYNQMNMLGSFYRQPQPSTSGTQQSFYFKNEYVDPDYNQPTRKRGRPRGKRGKSKMKAVSSFKVRKMDENYAEYDTESDEIDEDGFPIPHDMGQPLKPRKKPKPREFAHRLQWRNRDMLEAMKAVEEQKMTIRGAAKRFTVPYSTLKDRVHGRVRHGTKPGVKTILSPEEEEELVRFIRDMESAGFQLRCVDVRDRAAELLRLNHGHNSPYKESSPGHNWFHGFVKRHPGLEFKRTLKKNIVPSITKQKHMLRRFYDITAGVYKKYKLSHKADRIFSVTELHLGGQFQCTILYASSANGCMIPPFVVFRGVSLKLSAAKAEFPDAFFTCSSDGAVNEDIFLWWFRDHFLKKIPTSQMRPGVLFIGRGVQDLTMQLLQISKEERMNLIGMPFGISHLVQPLDEEVSEGLLHTSFNKKFQKWQDDNPGTPVTQKVVAQILRKVWTKVSPEEVAAKFTSNGIYPLNAYAITQDKLLTGAHVLREIVEQGGGNSRGDLSSQNLSGLNLLSALSSHEYASLDYYNPHDSTMSNASEDSESDVSISEMIPQDPHAMGVDYRAFKSENVTLVPFSDGGEGVQEQVEIATEVVETEVITEPTQEQAEQLLELKRELNKKRPRPTSDLLTRHSDVQNEIIQAKENEDQINKAIDSILCEEQQASTSIKKEVRIVSHVSSRTMTTPQRLIQAPQTPQIITIKSRMSNPGIPGNLPMVTATTRKPSGNSQVLEIAQEQIKQELSRALREVSSDSAPRVLRLSDPSGKDIKIHVRIRDDSKGSSPASGNTPNSSPAATGGRFIHVASPGGINQKVVIQSSTIRATRPQVRPSFPRIPQIQRGRPPGPRITIHKPNGGHGQGGMKPDIGPIVVIEPQSDDGSTIVDGVVSSDCMGDVYYQSMHQPQDECIIQYVDDIGQVVQEEVVTSNNC